jgi:large-conductance mechanosensitive channel
MSYLESFFEEVPKSPQAPQMPQQVPQIPQQVPQVPQQMPKMPQQPLLPQPAQKALQTPNAFYNFKKDDVYKGFRDFVVQNNILTTAAGMTIGFSTGVVVRSLVGDVLLPLIYKTIGAYLIKNVSQSAYEKMTGVFSTELNFDNFLKEAITWVFVILSAFFVINSVRKYLVGYEPVKQNPNNHVAVE